MGGEELCPGCQRVLYPAASLRPGPSLGGRALTVFGLGLAAAAVMYVLGLAILCIFVSLTARELVLAASLWLLASAAPALLAGRIAYSYPKIIRHHCRACGWRGSPESLTASPSQPKEADQG